MPRKTSRRRGLQNKRGASGFSRIKGFLQRVENSPARKRRVKKLKSQLRHGAKPTFLR